ncbi:unnamed protein product [Vitrella brassicaformis CCMP3155]|uniref:Elongation of fatty acids protein n=1 Tax=Vitrella brassicaformis (strain CCMP3155) TaxID=1169540 RepID=A0A0G4EHF6_VITBC|nr:unnamed protein product [Vitrella brassicaformis CCMP3155]|eukprot:CEL95413.1 unnamed protein product [Vitrella brassicaformis CCMP3155]
MEASSRWYEAYEESTDWLTHQTVTLFHPQLVHISPRPTETWPLVPLRHAFLIALAYIAWAVFGVLLKVSRRRHGDKGAGESEEKDGEYAATGGDGLGRKFAREPLLLLQAVYDVVQVGLCSVMLFQTIDVCWREGYKFYQNPFRTHGAGLAPVLWLFYVSKVVDFFDTVFIVVRGKWRQLSFIHVYHHLMTFVVYWISVQTAYDSDIYLTIAANSFVHVVMYFYYLMRTLDVPVPRVIKKNITNLQILQFIMMEVQGFSMLVFGTPFPIRVCLLYCSYVGTLLVLFVDFAVRTYGPRKPKKIDKAE